MSCLTSSEQSNCQLYHGQKKLIMMSAISWSEEVDNDVSSIVVRGS